MGIPKFFRFMSERYPLISQLIEENRIPEFDALYLDMNGIIHNCSHPDDNNASFRMTEEAIFLGVFAYVTHLFSVIKPKKLFFLAVDGVAPRAKMNQQRSRRFRTAREMKEVLDKAKAKGEEIPEGDGFDSNCITPGTPFMARLSAQLKYLIAKKVSEDADWRGVEIVLSGHEVPGEGEHKIMEYIRLSKAQPGYDPNVRHCLYGLDADLIMLGLLSHDPHFCLLREEVTFGGAKGGKGKAKVLETQNFFLMHLSLFREYLDLEFSSLKTSTPALPFEYDLERIIDDFILLNIFVGNDFLPHLPGLHINDGALGRLFEIYKKILPHAGGYLNEHGILNVQRLQLVLNELTVFETEHFEHEFADSSWYKGKQTKNISASEKAPGGTKLVVTKDQRKILFQVKQFINDNLAALSPNARLVLPAAIPSRDRKFLAGLCDELKLSVAYDEFDQAGKAIIVLSFEEAMIQLALAEEEDDEEEDGEWKEAITRIVKKYEKADIAEHVEDSYEKQLESKMSVWKKDYYREKLEFDYGDEKSLHDLAYRYIEGLQWVLHYYYSGVASWGWFYNYHYAPKISDLQFAGSYKFDFKLGTPFHPFEQLMGVLPDLSSSHIPLAFRDLLSDPTSPIIDFYPADFVSDLNGKKQDWEAIVKIPFIDEQRLLATMAKRASRLTDEERARNSFGSSWRFIYNTDTDIVYPSSLPGFFPDLLHCKTKLEAFELPTLGGGLKYLPGLVPGVLLGKDAISGFPSLHTIPYTGRLDFHSVSVFQGDSRKETMVVTVDNLYDGLASEAIAKTMIDKRTFVGYPYLQEAHVVGISDELFRYELEEFKGEMRVRSTPHRPEGVGQWKRTADRLEYVYSKKTGCIIGNVEVLVHARLLKGLKRMDDGSTEKEFEDREQEFALQSTVQNVTSEDVRYVERPPLPIELELPYDSKVFFLGAPAYGVPAQVIGHDANDTLAIRVAFFPNDAAENSLFKKRLAASSAPQYALSRDIARQLRISGLTLSKLTSSMMITASGDSKVNIGLNLKFEAKAQKVLGYSQKGESGWEFSNKAVELIREYISLFPEIANGLDRSRGGDLMRAADFFDSRSAESRLKELKAWIAQKGVRDFDKVPLYSDQLEKETVASIEKLADNVTASKVMTNVKLVIIKGMPRSAVLKPAHAGTRLREQSFALGDRAIIVADTGAVPLCAKGVVVGIQSGFVDVVFDVAFIGGTTLGGRCSDYRGATVSPSTLLNLTQPQFVVETNMTPDVPTPTRRGPANAKFTRGPLGGPAILPAAGLPAGGFHPAGASSPRRGGHQNGVQVLQNPSRPFDGSYGPVARGTAPPIVASPQRTHQQNLGSVLGIQSPNRGRGGYSNGSPRGGMMQNQPQMTPAMRGGIGGGAIRGAVPFGRGIAIPPPGDMNAARGGGGLRGRGQGQRGGPRGGVGRGGAEGEVPVARG